MDSRPVDGHDEFLASLAGEMRTFIADRRWSEFHTPKNLAMALAGEAGELVAEFQWLTPEQSLPEHMPDDKRDAIESEMADVLIYLVVLADRMGTSLPEAVRTKMAQNAVRFPPAD